VSFFGLGFLPAPGTLGSLGALVLVFGLSFFSLSIKLILFLGFNLLFFYWVQSYLKLTGSKDPSEVVLDEVSGLWLALLPFGFDWKLWGLGFVLFRLLDIFKPFWIGRIDREVSGSWGVMGDDLLAGLITQALLWGYLWL